MYYTCDHLYTFINIIQKHNVFVWVAADFEQEECLGAGFKYKTEYETD